MIPVIISVPEDATGGFAGWVDVVRDYKWDHLPRKGDTVEVATEPYVVKDVRWDHTGPRVILEPRSPHRPVDWWIQRGYRRIPPNPRKADPS